MSPSSRGGARRADAGEFLQPAAGGVHQLGQLSFATLTVLSITASSWINSESQ
jgi:hypothetical protein